MQRRHFNSVAVSAFTLLSVAAMAHAHAMKAVPF
jgi:hypothetical protein